MTLPILMSVRQKTIRRMFFGLTLETLYDTETGKDSEMPEVKQVPVPAWFRNVPAQFYAEEDVDMEDDLTM